MRKIRLLAFLLFLFINGICSAEIYGRIISKDKNFPVKYARVEIITPPEITLTDENGKFTLQTDQKNVSIQISALGYKTKIVKNIFSSNSPITIFLKTSPIPIRGIEVKGEKKNSLTSHQINVEILKVGDQDRTDIFSTLEMNSGIILREDSKGEKNVSLNCCDPKQLAILIDGVKVNSGGGVFSVGKIPVEMIDRIEVVKNDGSALVGNSAIGGIINFILKTASQKSEGHSISVFCGSWDKYIGNYQGKFNLGQFGFLLNLNYENSQNDFFYYNEIENQKVRRQNNVNENKSVNLKINRKWNYDFVNNFSLFLQKDRKGIPGQTTDYMHYLHANAVSSLFHLKYDAEFNLHNTSIRWGNFYQNQKSHYKNLETDNYFFKYDSQNITEMFETKLNWEKFWQNFRNNNFAGFRYETYKFDNLISNSIEESIPLKIRKFLYLANSATYSNQIGKIKFDLNSALRFDSVLEERNLFSATVGAKIQPLFLENSTLSINAGNSFRMPEFTSLFWKGDSRVMGNPDLNPEKSRSISTKLSWQPYFASIAISGFSNRIDDLIYWHQSALGIWTPDNLADAEISGISANLELHFCDWFSFSGSSSKFLPLNKSADSDHYNKFLVYKPLHKINGKIEFSYNEFKINFSLSKLGKQYASFDNNVKLDGYLTCNANLNFKKRLKKIQFIAVLSVRNIFDESYEIYRNIPSSGSEFGVKLKIVV
ncbi:MAG: TonB-dependent receptor [Candidatus Cloacimonadota bacterium]|nr:TonB-dependent receptor [Candidatus Cloacimonadota bacterium]